MVLQTILVMHMFSSPSCHALGVTACHSSMPLVSSTRVLLNVIARTSTHATSIRFAATGPLALLRNMGLDAINATPAVKAALVAMASGRGGGGGSNSQAAAAAAGSLLSHFFVFSRIRISLDAAVQSRIMFLQTVLVMNLISLLVPCTRMPHEFMPRTSSNEPPSGSEGRSRIDHATSL